MEQVCMHQIDRKEKRTCEACRRAVYRAKQRLEASDHLDKTFAPIDDFYAIPEIKKLVEYSEANHLHEKTIRKHRNNLERMWTWIRECKGQTVDGATIPDFTDTQRPILWEEKHVIYILKKLGELQIARYDSIQALRRFFEANKRNDMLKHQILRARAKDMRSPRGLSRITNRFTPSELMNDILSVCDEDEAFCIRLHVTLKSREGARGKSSLLNLKWSDINWNDSFYGFDMVTASIFESKTGGGILWEHCPIDLWFGDMSMCLKERYTCRTSEYVLPYKTEAEYTKLWQKISEKLGKDFEPHDCRRSAGGWLRDLGLSDLALGQVDMASGRATGFTGVGWENPKIYYDRYGKMNPLGIYDKKQRFDTSMFNGLIGKILEQKNAPY